MSWLDCIPWRSRDGSPAAVASTQVDQLWKRGLTGKGVGIAIIDSGCAPHELLDERVVAFEDFLNGHQQPYDDFFHGTAISTIAAGSIAGKFKGVAPEAHLAILKVMDNEGSVGNSEVVKALQWVKQNRERYNLQVVNMSLGVNSPSAKKAVDELAEMGVIICTSAGNEGFRPAPLGVVKGSDSVITVANVDCQETAHLGDDVIDPTSSYVHPGDPKGPTVGAPGVNLSIGWHKGGVKCFERGGTSFATAWASGVMALWKQAMPAMEIAQARRAIEASSHPIAGAAREAQGSGLLQAAAGLDFLQAQG